MELYSVMMPLQLWPPLVVATFTGKIHCGIWTFNIEQFCGIRSAVYLKLVQNASTTFASADYGKWMKIG